MATRSTNVGNFATGDVLTEAHMDSLPAGCIAYTNQATAQASISTTETDLTGLSLPTPSLNANRLMQVAVHIVGSGTAVSDQVIARIREGGTELGAAAATVGQSSTAVRSYTLAFATTPFKPAAGVHTYKATLQRGNGTGSLSTEASATAQLWIAVYDLGPAFP